MPAPMPPGLPPPYRQAAAWPISWNAADATVRPRMSSSSSGLSNAWAVAGATPSWISTNQRTAAKPRSAGSTIHGRNSHLNGAVIRPVTLGSVNRTFQRSASSGFGRSGAFSSEHASRRRGPAFAASAPPPLPLGFRRQRPDVLGAELAPEPLRHRGGHGGVVACAVQRLEQRVHE